MKFMWKFWKISRENESLITIDRFSWNLCENFGKSLEKMKVSLQSTDFHEIYVKILENLSRKWKLHYNRTKVTGTLYEDQYTFLVISHSSLLRIRDVSENIVEKIKTHVSYLISFFLIYCRLCDNMEKYSRAG